MERALPSCHSPIKVSEALANISTSSGRTKWLEWTLSGNTVHRPVPS